MSTTRHLRHLGIAVPVAIAATLVAVMAPAAAPLAIAAQGGASVWTAPTTPCTAPCSFLGDDTAPGLDGVPIDGSAHANAAWWLVEIATAGSYTIRVSAVDPHGWRPTVVLADAGGVVLAHHDDQYGRDSAVTVDLTEGTYALALAGHDADQAGTAMIDIVAGTPSVPALVSAAPTSGGAQVSWEAPDDHGDPITEYLVHVDGDPVPTSVAGDTTTATLDGLTIGEPHVFEVAAANAHGTSARSMPTDAVVPVGDTTTTVTFSSATVAFPSSVEVIATVSAPTSVNEGVVTFWRNGTKLGDVAVLNGEARLPLQSLTPGTYSYVANYRGTTYLIASSGSGTITVSRGTQVISFTAPEATAWNAGPVTVAPTSTSGLTVAVTSTTTSVCRVSARTVTLLTVGTCSLTASQAGNANYLAATPVTRSFAVIDPATTTSSSTTTTTEPPTTSSTTTTTTSTTTTTTTTEPPATTTTSTSEPATTEPPTTTTPPATSTTEPPTTTSTTTTTTTVVPPPAVPMLRVTPVTRVLDATLEPGITEPVAVESAAPGNEMSTVVVSITVSDADADGHLFLFACGDGPVTRTTPVVAGRSITVPAVVPVEPISGRICVRTDRRAHVRLDVVSWSAADGPLHGTEHTRLALPAAPAGVVPAGTAARVQVAGVAGVPADGVSAVALGISATGTSSRAIGTLWAWRCGARPEGGAVRITGSAPALGLAVVPVGPADGTVCLATDADAIVELVVQGWIGRADEYAPRPLHLLDTRPGSTGWAPHDGALPPGFTHRVLVASAAAPRAVAAVVHVAATGTTDPALVVLRSCDGSGERVTLHAPVGAWSAASALLPSTGRGWCLTTLAAVHVTIDVDGWFTAPSG